MKKGSVPMYNLLIQTFYLEQCLIREDPVSKLVSQSSSIIPNPPVSNSAKNPVKITSVVLDGIFDSNAGLEMKLTSNGGFGFGKPSNN
jgi:hypothetical protein